MFCKYKFPNRTQLLNHNGLTEVLDYYVDSEGHYVSLNPKLKDGVRGMRLALDRPSTTGSVPMEEIYSNPLLDNYTPYNVNNGQISYYIDNELRTPFPSYVYQMSQNYIQREYVDPMNAVKPVSYTHLTLPTKA